MTDSPDYDNSSATWEWDGLIYYGVIDPIDDAGMPDQLRRLWACPHEHTTADAAFDCAVDEQTRGAVTADVR